MTIAEFMQVSTGLYEIIWSDGVGGFSVGAIGVDAKGRQWLAPANWVEAVYADDAHYEKTIAKIQKLVPIPLPRDPHNLESFEASESGEPK